MIKPWQCSNLSTRSRRQTACRPGPPCGGSEPAPPRCWSPSRWCRSEAEPPGTCWRRSARRESRCRAEGWRISPLRSPRTEGATEGPQYEQIYQTDAVLQGEIELVALAQHLVAFLGGVRVALETPTGSVDINLDVFEERLDQALSVTPRVAVRHHLSHHSSTSLRIKTVMTIT